MILLIPLSFTGIIIWLICAAISVHMRQKAIERYNRIVQEESVRDAQMVHAIAWQVPQSGVSPLELARAERILTAARKRKGYRDPSPRYIGN